MSTLAWPSCMLVSGPSGSGKTTFCARLIAEAAVVYERAPGLVYYCYNEWQPAFEALARDSRVHMHDGLPDLAELKRLREKRVLLILDDLMTRLDKFPDAEKLFSVASHHYDMSCIAIIHSIFYSKTIRNLRLNSSYLCLFKNNADRLSIRNLASQLYPTNRAFFIESYEDATHEPHSYLFVDLHKTTDERFRLRTSIFAGETAYCYLERRDGGTIAR